MSNLYKLYTRMVTTWQVNKMDLYQPVEQAGFLRIFGTNDHFQSNKILTKRQKKLTDCQSWHSLIFIRLSIESIEQQFCKCFKNDYEYDQLITTSTMTVKLNRNTDRMSFRRGAKQGDTISCKLFITVRVNAFKQLNWDYKGISIDNKYLHGPYSCYFK